MLGLFDPGMYSDTCFDIVYSEIYLDKYSDMWSQLGPDSDTYFDIRFGT